MRTAQQILELQSYPEKEEDIHTEYYYRKVMSGNQSLSEIRAIDKVDAFEITVSIISSVDWEEDKRLLRERADETINTLTMKECE